MIRDIQIKNRWQSLPENMIVFGRTMAKTGFVAITFPDDPGAKRLCNALDEWLRTGLIEVQHAIVVEKDRHGNLKTKIINDLAVGGTQSCLLDFVVGLLLGGSVADELLGGAAGTLLSHDIDLGIPQAKIDKMILDMAAGSSTLFIQDCSNLTGAFHAPFSQANGKFHDLPMREQAFQAVQIMASTLPHYWQ